MLKYLIWNNCSPKKARQFYIYSATLYLALQADVCSIAEICVLRNWAGLLSVINKFSIKMSKAAGKLKALKKAAVKIIHTTKLRTNIPAGMAAAGPPLGPMLGQRAINIAAFCKDFNTRTAEMKEGVPLPCRISVNSDRSYNLTIHSPPATFLLKQAAGISRGAMQPGREIAGMITLKHLYEIAAIKIQDPPNALLTMQQMCEMLVGVARTCGIKIVRELQADEYSRFLEERRTVVEEQRRELQEKRDAKMLRTG